MFYYEKIMGKLNELDKVVGYDVPPRLLIAGITKAINRIKLPTKVVSNITDIETMTEINPYSHHNPNDFFVSGGYDDEWDEQGKPGIKLYWLIPEAETIRITKKLWTLTKFGVCDIVEHEIIHCEQFRSRNYEYDSKILVPKEDYFSDQDEIQAYAVNIARELWRKKSSINNWNKSPTLKLYKKTFKKHPKVLRELYKWIYYYRNRM